MSATAAGETGVAGIELRTAIGHFATGVTVVTATDAAGRDFGSTANAISSVSLEPPLVLVCLRRESETLGTIVEARRFAINVLRDGQRQLAERFARTASRDSWAGVPYGPAPVTGAPLIGDALATLECELHDVADGGDHAIVIGRVLAVEHPAEHVTPLLFYRGAFAAPPPPPEPVEPPEVVQVSLPSAFGDLRLLAAEGDDSSVEVLALVGEPEGSTGTFVYVHEGCVLGDVLGHAGCAGRDQLRATLERMRFAGAGVVVYRRDDATAFGACCLTAGGRNASRRRHTDALRHTLVGLGLRRVRLLTHDGSVGEATRALGLDVAEVVA